MTEPKKLGPLFEGTTGVYTFHLVDEASLGIDKAVLNTLTLTYRDIATGAILNSRESQNTLETNNVALTTVTSPALQTTLTWSLQLTDTVRHDVLREIEQHLAVFQWSWGGGQKHAAHIVQVGIRALSYTLEIV